MKEVANGGQWRLRLSRVCENGSGAFAKSFQAFQEQAALVTEAAVETAAGNTHGGQQVRQGGGGIAAPPEQFQSLVHRLIAVEFEFSCHENVLAAWEG